MFFGLLVRNAAGMSQNVALAQPEKVVEFRDPVGHVHRSMRTRLQFREVVAHCRNSVPRGARTRYPTARIMSRL
jgi:hypothetical protein